MEKAKNIIVQNEKVEEEWPSFTMAQMKMDMKSIEQSAVEKLQRHFHASTTDHGTTVDPKTFLQFYEQELEDANMFCSIFELQEQELSSVQSQVNENIKNVAATSWKIYAFLKKNLIALAHMEKLMYVINLSLLTYPYHEPFLEGAQKDAQVQFIEQKLRDITSLEWKVLHIDKNEELRGQRDRIIFARDVKEYLNELKKCNGLVVPAHWSYDASNAGKAASFHNMSSNDSYLGQISQVSTRDEYQDGKDIKRDKLLINGVLHTGVKGYGSLVTTLADRIKMVATEAHCETIWNPETQAPDHIFSHETEAYIAFAKKIIQVANRTQSGGCSFEVLETLIRHPEWSILRPKSEKADPLVVKVDMGPYLYLCPETGHDKWAWGLRATVEAFTSYVVVDAMEPMNEWMNVNTTYKNHLAISLNMSPFTNQGTHRASRLDRGHVVVQVSLIHTDILNGDDDSPYH